MLFCLVKYNLLANDLQFSALFCVVAIVVIGLIGLGIAKIVIGKFLIITHAKQRENFSAVKIENFIRKILKVLIIWLKTEIVGTR